MQIRYLHENGFFCLKLNQPHHFVIWFRSLPRGIYFLLFANKLKKNYCIRFDCWFPIMSVDKKIWLCSFISDAFLEWIALLKALMLNFVGTQEILKTFIVNFHHIHQNPLHIIRSRLSNFIPHHCHFINVHLLHFIELTLSLIKVFF